MLHDHADTEAYTSLHLVRTSKEPLTLVEGSIDYLGRYTMVLDCPSV